ncbi:dTDP-4-dehydrorhamnose reductase [Aureimonas sp. Leaf454]|uniref:dTDP-4-dehydrorhamnose reductase n=1 Tax=Aureimonas sp. Leaf454 TaxID=1736381 RepID=UPI0006FA4FB4|nr:dTDP-4-dehydrorhamnose reductase [Aureimonas sp. Leaf454]KQT54153.1 dTDP-4-dehydrorhamnose reductase [Aureimonas sp. Leaf454]
MKLLVTGRDGQVARSLQALSGPDIDVVALGRPLLDITDRASVERAIAEHRPDVVVSAAAYTAVDKAESDVEAAFAVNRDGAAHVAAVAAAANLPLLHLSTDYVFPGIKSDPYVESDATGPSSIYGRSKLEGEEAVLRAHSEAVVLRTAWVYSPYGNNFLKTMLRLAGDRDRLRVVGDQMGTPTYAPDIAQALVVVARQVLARSGRAADAGIFHMVATGATNWAGFATEIFRQSAERGGPSAEVEAITTADYPTPARRPPNSRLDTTKFETTFAHALPHWQDGIRRCLDALAAS